ncbi:MAG: tetratricopeptide repeat protein, partial [Caldilineaceae bacterium]|nr:tetratricopeptide repeat protein [Caldilineaceae bacterium]
VAYTLQGEYEKAITEYQQITQADTAYFEAYNNLGYTYLEQGKLDFAEEELLKALKQNPPQPVVSCIRKNLGRVHFAREDFDAAAGDLELAIAEKNTSCYVEALYYLALAYHTLDLIDQACDTLFDYAFVAEHDEETRADQVGQLFDLWACS